MDTFSSHLSLHPNHSTGRRTCRSNTGRAGQQAGHGGVHERGGGAPSARAGSAEKPNVPNIQNIRHQRGRPRPGDGLAVERVTGAEIAPATAAGPRFFPFFPPPQTLPKPLIPFHSPSIIILTCPLTLPDRLQDGAFRHQRPRGVRRVNDVCSS